jgi:hypothetical protein
MVSLPETTAIRSFPMSTTLPQVSQALRHILGEVAQQAAKEAGFSQRQSKLDGAVFLQTLVFGWLNNPQASLQALSQTSAALGVKVTPQALDQRFSLQAAHYIQQVMQAALRELIYAEPAAVPILERFRAIIRPGWFHGGAAPGTKPPLAWLWGQWR